VPPINVPHPNGADASAHSPPLAWDLSCFNPSNQIGLANEVLLAGDGRTRPDPSRQYGTGGKMQGKKFMICATWNAPREAFDNPNGVLYAGKGTADLFLHITSNYKFTGYDILPDSPS
jgi:hypothetical protein